MQWHHGFGMSSEGHACPTKLLQRSRASACLTKLPQRSQETPRHSSRTRALYGEFADKATKFAKDSGSKALLQKLTQDLKDGKGIEI
jgi:hypothetical protein